MLALTIDEVLKRERSSHPWKATVVCRPVGSGILTAWGSEKSGKLEVGGASRDSTGFGALDEGLISS